MKPFVVTLGLVVACIAVSCKPSGGSKADTAVAADSVALPAQPSGPMDSVSQVVPGAQSTSASPAARTSAGTPSTKKTPTSTNSNRAASDSGIIGRDSVLRFPHRGLPTVSSTPRK